MPALGWIGALQYPVECAFIPEQRDITGIGLYNGFRSTVPRYEVWRAYMVWPDGPSSKLHPVYAHLMRARGTQQALEIPHFGYQRLMLGGGGAVGGVTLAAAVTAGDLSITLSSSAFAPGDYVQITNGNSPRLYQLTSQAGNLYGCWPEQRWSNAVGKSVEHAGNVSRLACTMHVAGGMPAAPSFPSATEDKFVKGFAVEFEEALTWDTLA